MQGSGGGAPVRAVLPPAAREAGGLKGGAASPRQLAVFNTGWAGLRSSGSPALALMERGVRSRPSVLGDSPPTTPAYPSHRA